MRKWKWQLMSHVVVAAAASMATFYLTPYIKETTEYVKVMCVSEVADASEKDGHVYVAVVIADHLIGDEVTDQSWAKQFISERNENHWRYDQTLKHFGFTGFVFKLQAQPLVQVAGP